MRMRNLFWLLLAWDSAEPFFCFLNHDFRLRLARESIKINEYHLIIGTFIPPKKHTHTLVMTKSMPPNTDFTIQHNTMRYDMIRYNVCVSPNWSKYRIQLRLLFFSIIITALFKCMWKSCFIAAYNKHLSLVLCHVLVVMRAHALILPNPFSFFIFDVCSCVRSYSRITMLRMQHMIHIGIYLFRQLYRWFNYT